ncbi:MAG: transketolase C-terminal domain-containing protein [Thermoplasmata archaeon]
MRTIGLTGDEAVAYAAKQARVDVVAAYPITPQTIMVELFSEYVANGEVQTEFVCVESEHSAMSACVGASLAGGRVFTATASQGLALMHEILYIASSLRCPIVMGVANRALSAPINIHGDHSDMMGSRDSGWIQIYAENAQEAYDWTLQAFRIAEDHDVLLPVSVNIDGFILSHSMEGVSVLEDQDVQAFIPPRKPLYSLDPEKPITVGALALPDYYMEFKRQQDEAMNGVMRKIKEVNEIFREISGRRYSPVEAFWAEDADAAIVCLGSTAGTARVVARELRSEGKKVGVIKVSSYRPFPSEEITKLAGSLKAITVLDKACSYGAPYGPLGSDVAASLSQLGRNVPLMNVIYGLGGRDIAPQDLRNVFEETLKIAENGAVERRVKFIGVRE